MNKLLPRITSFNVSTTINEVTVVRDSAAELDGSSDFLADDTATFTFVLTGGDKPDQVYIVWNETGAGNTNLVAPPTGAWTVTNLNMANSLTALNISSVNVSRLHETNTTVGSVNYDIVYSATLSLVGNNSNNFAKIDSYEKRQI